ncbi:MAG: LON peptidase substrate-binding domain-containing protein [Alphaproteobacteria bacterium]|jgi:hypothetical protein|nr:LON peptidase substrate-binding domain-containing protein [Alphaproteobacteria bacterium]MDP6516070.1 LON peptidase substrate-binding domain-containing protein [Alphaproteobacteria bacterium]
MPAPTIAQLPEAIPIFPLAGVLLLPGGQLPLNIFEPRYLAMTRDALASDWMIGMVQPVAPEEASDRVEVYRIGCAGRITSLSETDDGRYLISLSGLCRFEIADEPASRKGYRRVIADWSRFTDDLATAERGALDRDRLLSALRNYFESHHIWVDWKALENAPGDQLVTSLAMACPFAPREKQALLESPSPGARAELMISLLAMSVLDRADGTAAPH